MNSLMKFAVGVSVGAGVFLGGSNVAKALDFTFSLTNNAGSTPGTVTFTMFGLPASGTGVPTSIVVTSAPAALSSFIGVDVLQPTYVTNSGGSYTVTGGVITDGFAWYLENGGSVPGQFVIDFGSTLAGYPFFVLTDESGFLSYLGPIPPVAVPYEFESATGLAILGLGYGLNQLRKKRMAAKGKSTPSDSVIDGTITEAETEEKELTHV